VTVVAVKDRLVSRPHLTAPGPIDLVTDFWCTGTEDAEHTYEGLVRAFEWFGGAPGEVLADASRWVPSLTPPVPDAHHRGLVGPGRLRLPRWWIEMLEVARRVSWARPTPFLRVDMFSSVDGPVIGELTPTPGGPHYGMWRFKPWFDHELGQGWLKAARRLDRHQHRRSSA